jgi:uncharacterized membrane protein YjgN (DUF898 family)
MNTTHASVPAVPAAAAPVSPAAGAARFLGLADAFWRLLARGAVLLMFTLGIYRFWLTTDIRRFLWSNTEVGGESFEYTGTARELLLGFLMAIAILVPLYVAFFLLALAFGETWSTLGLVAITFLGQYAVYRARRYRLTRTVYRGVRFHQEGSAWRYSICAVYWWGLVALTLGLAYPFAQSHLESFKMRYTFFGNLPGAFEGSGWRLFARGILLWFIAVVPFVIGMIGTIGAIDWDAVRQASASDLSAWLESSGVAGALVIGALTCAWFLLAITILYPIFQAILLRWWVSGLRFGEVAVKSRLRTAQIYGVYARFLAYALLFTLVAAIVAAIGAYSVSRITPYTSDTVRTEVITTALGLAAYVAAALGYSAIYQATVKLGLWRCVIETLDVSNVSILEQVAGAGEPASPIGEGLADALNVGSL